MTNDIKLNILMVLGWIGAALIFILPVAALLAFIMWWGYDSCNAFANLNPDFDVVWVRQSGCMVKYNGMFVPVNDVVNVLGGR